MKNESQLLDLLRQKAESLLSTDKRSITNIEKIEVKKAFHDLQVQQLELEMQNEELQRVTTELEEQKTKYANLFDLAPIAYFVISNIGQITNINKAALQLLEIEKLALNTKPLLLYILEEDRDNFYKFFHQLFLSPVTKSCQVRLCNSKNQILNVQIEGGVVKHNKTAPTCLLTVTDFTGKQQAELKLVEAKKTLEIALNASATGIWEIDIVSGKVYMDDFCCQLYGFGLREFDCKYDTMMNRIHQNDRRNMDENIRKTIIHDIEFNIKYRISIPNTDLRYVQSRAQMIVDEQGKKRFIGTFTDISEKTMMELEAIRVKEEQQQMILSAGLQAEENEKKRISEVLHNGVAQMLYAIKINLSAMKKADQEGVFNQITSLLNDSIKDIRNISFELAPSILTDFGLSATLEDLAARLSNQQLSIQTKVTNITKATNIQLQLNIFRIVQELVNNGIKHAQAKKIMIEVIKKNKVILITVADNGIGFETDNPAEVPKGIGLSSIKNRLQLYKGKLKIESQPNAGTTVFISLKP